MKIALLCALLLCLCMIALGGIILLITIIPFLLRCVLALLCILPGVGLGAICIDLWRD